MDLKFGIILLQTIPWSELIKRCKFVEDLNFDFLWLADHFVGALDKKHILNPWFECWTSLAAVATQTTNIRIGTLVNSAPLRHPGLVARQAMTIDHISNGRLELGLGTGISGSKGEVAYEMLGIDDWEPTERVERFEEQVQIIDQALKQPLSTFNGKYYTTTDLAISPSPIQKPRPPLTIAALGKKMIIIAAKYADSWNSFGEGKGKSSDQLLDELKKRLNTFEQVCDDIGRDSTIIRKSYLTYGPEVQEIYQSTRNFREFVESRIQAGINELIIYWPFSTDGFTILPQIAIEIANLKKKYSDRMKYLWEKN